jgi:O-antigen ligase
MQSRNSTYSIIPVVALLSVTLLTGALHLYIVANLIILISCCLFYITNKQHIIFLFVVLLPTNGFFSTEHNIAGLLSQLFALIVLFPEFRKIKTSGISRIAEMFVLALFIFNVYYDFKNAYYDIYDLDYEIAVKRLIKYSFRFGSIYLLIKAIDKKYFAEITTEAIHIGVVLLILSSIFTVQLSDLGFLTTDASESTDTNASIVRASGFFAFGDVNSFGGMLSSYLGFLLILISRAKKTNALTVLLGFSLIGLIYTGSRTAITGFAVVFILFLFTQFPRIETLKKLKWIIVLPGVIMLVFYFFQENILLVLSRFTEAGNEVDSSHTGSRIYKWGIYLDYIWNNPLVWLVGTKEELMLNLGIGFWQARVPHNFYITTFFQCGALLLIFFLYLWYKLIRTSLKQSHFFLVLIPILAISFYVSDWGYFQYFVIYLPLLNSVYGNNS